MEESDMGDLEDTTGLDNSMQSPLDPSALVEQHLDLVQHVVFQVAAHFPRHVEREELIRAGALGLVEAAKRYSPERGIPFNRFASQRIRGAIIDAVRAADWAPRSVRTLARQLDQAEQRLAGQLGRRPSLAETATELGVETAELDQLRARVNRSVIVAFDHLVTGAEDEELNLLDIVSDPDDLDPSEELERRELHAYVRQAVAVLPERHRLIVLGYFIEGRTSEDLARFLGVTESRVSQMRSEALGMMRRGIEAQFVAPEDRVAPEGLVERRRAAYADAIGAASDCRDRLVPVDDTVTDEAFAALLAVG
jgi:RNA polymerase sigma factor for flagellar operon FliA